LTHVNAVLLTT